MIQAIKFEFADFELSSTQVLKYGDTIDCFNIAAKSFPELQRYSKTIGHTLLLNAASRLAHQEAEDFMAVYVLTNSKDFSTYVFVLLEDKSGLLVYEQDDTIYMKKCRITSKTENKIIWKSETGLKDIHQELLC